MTFLLEIIRLGLKNLRLHLLRSVLTSLGIILGVAAVISILLQSKKTPTWGQNPRLEYGRRHGLRTTHDPRYHACAPMSD